MAPQAENMESMLEFQELLEMTMMAPPHGQYLSCQGGPGEAREQQDVSGTTWAAWTMWFWEFFPIVAP